MNVNVESGQKPFEISDELACDISDLGTYMPYEMVPKDVYDHDKIPFEYRKKRLTIGNVSWTRFWNIQLVWALRARIHVKKHFPCRKENCIKTCRN